MSECEHELIIDIIEITGFPRSSYRLLGTKCKICDQKRDMSGEKLRDMREPDCLDVGHISHYGHYCSRCGLPEQMGSL